MANTDSFHLKLTCIFLHAITLPFKEHEICPHSWCCTVHKHRTEHADSMWAASLPSVTSHSVFL